MNLQKLPIQQALCSIIKNPQDSQPYHALAELFVKEKSGFEGAITSIKKAIIISPLTLEFYHCLGYYFCQILSLEEAILAWKKYNVLYPADPILYNNLAYVLRSVMRLKESEITFLRAIVLKPDFGPAHANLSLVVLGQGRFREGWVLYERRWDSEEMKHQMRSFSSPQWTGEEGKGRTLLIHAEQGFGDTIQFCRYVKLAARRDWRVILEVQPELVRLLSKLEGASLVLGRGQTLPYFDSHCPMLSLPGIFKTDIDTIPSSKAYIFPQQNQIDFWNRRLAIEYGKAPRIGLLWAGNPRIGLNEKDFMDKRRSIPLKMLEPFFTREDCLFFSLQKDDQFLEEIKGTPVHSHMKFMNDFADTAAFIVNLDLVIAVDSAVTHLASAVGTPVWMLDRHAPCWRWLPDRDDSPWYPFIRIFRQKKTGDWSSAIKKAQKAFLENNFSKIRAQ